LNTVNKPCNRIAHSKLLTVFNIILFCYLLLILLLNVLVYRCLFASSLLQLTRGCREHFEGLVFLCFTVTMNICHDP